MALGWARKDAGTSRPSGTKMTSDGSLLTLRTRGESLDQAPRDSSGIRSTGWSILRQTAGPTGWKRCVWVKGGKKVKSKFPFFFLRGEDRRGDHQSYNPPECCLCLPSLSIETYSSGPGVNNIQLPHGRSGPRGVQPWLWWGVHEGCLSLCLWGLPSAPGQAKTPNLPGNITALAW